MSAKFVITPAMMAIIDVARASHALSQKICHEHGSEKGELHGIIVKELLFSHDETGSRVSASVRFKVGNGREETHNFEDMRVFIEKVDGRWIPRAIEYYDGTVRIELSVTAEGQIVFGKETLL